MIKPVILAGGVGSRLWPLSREAFPKQLLKLVGEKSLLQETLLRASRFTKEKPLIITNENYRFLIASQLKEIDLEAEIVLEPFGKNTAPAIAVAAFLSPEKILCVMPSDHYIPCAEEFNAALHAALPFAEQGKLVTFGVLPTKPETGYGYIKAQEGKIERFIEKPDEKTAQKCLEEGYLWNSGMFLFKAAVYLEELKKFEAQIYEACAAVQIERDLDFLRIEREEFMKSPAKSVDHAVMEKTVNSVVVPLNTAWTDLGTWDSLYEILEKDPQGNVVQGNAVCRHTQNCFIHSSGRLIAAIGLKDQIIVETDDAILIASKKSAQEIKGMAELNQEHKTVYRPWGYYKTVDRGERFQVKRITVNPGAKLSLQLHHHRSEHWTVVRGTARITNGAQVFTLTENQSTYIPSGTVHRLENPGKIDLELIEVQTGSYLGEDDIVRLQDDYNRCELV